MESSKSLMKKRQTEPLYKADNKNIYYSDFVSSLREAGIKNGDTIFVHSRISAFGKLCTFDKNFLLQALSDALKECVGKDGTIIMPTFTYSFDKNEAFDMDNTKSTVGVLTEFFRKEKDVSRTIHPNHSAAIWGKNKNNLLKISKDTFDENSILGKLHKLNGKIVFLGAPFQSCTFIHYIEQMHKVPYRYMRKFRGKIIAHGKEYEDEISFYNKYNFFFSLFSKLEKYLLNKGLMREVKIGNGDILMVESDILFKEGHDLLDKDIYFFLKNEPIIFKLFNVLIYPFLRYMPWLVGILDKAYSRFMHG